MILNHLYSFLLVSFIKYANSFVWNVHDVIKPQSVITYSERYMFKTKHGPTFLQQGHSYIHLMNNIEAVVHENNTIFAQLAILAVDDDDHSLSLPLCGLIEQNNVWEKYPWAKNVMTRKIQFNYKRSFKTPEGKQRYIYAADIEKKYSVKLEAWHNVQIQVCSTNTNVDYATVTGQVVFHNPYGFISGELYGMLPFQATRFIITSIVMLFYLLYFLKYQESVLQLHKGILFVLSVATVESALWFATYEHINSNGEPYCCPFPPLVVASLMVEVFCQTFSRSLLLIVSLGYGIVRPRLLRSEWIAIFIISFLYFASALSYQVADIIALDLHHLEAKRPRYVQVPLMFIDLLFLSWIYLSLSSTIRILKEYQQTHKQLMYEQLNFVIAIFVCAFIAISLIFNLNQLGVLEWPWQWNWVQKVVWEALNFVILYTVCFICRPSETSLLLSYMAQIPSEDSDDVEGLELCDHPGEDDEGGEDVFASGGSSKPGFKEHFDDHNTLPAADDEFENDYGLDEA